MSLIFLIVGYTIIAVLYNAPSNYLLVTAFLNTVFFNGLVWKKSYVMKF